MRSAKRTMKDTRPGIYAITSLSRFAFIAVLVGAAVAACASVRRHPRPDACSGDKFFYSDEFCSLQGACHEVGDGRCYERCTRDTDCHDDVLPECRALGLFAGGDFGGNDEVLICGSDDVPHRRTTRVETQARPPPVEGDIL